MLFWDGDSQAAVQDVYLRVVVSRRLTRFTLSTLVVNAVRWEMRSRAESHRLRKQTQEAEHAYAYSRQEAQSVSEPFDAEAYAILDRALLGLPYRGRLALELHFGLGDGHAYSTKVIGGLFGVGSARVCQIIASALLRLRTPRTHMRRLNQLFLDLQALRRHGVRSGGSCR